MVLVGTDPVALDGALQVSFTNGFTPQPGNFFNALSCASWSGKFTGSNTGSLCDRYYAKEHKERKA